MLDEIFARPHPQLQAFSRKTAAPQAPLAKKWSGNAAPKAPQAPQTTALRRRRRRWWRRRRHKHANCKIIDTYNSPCACICSYTVTWTCVTLVFKYVCGLVYDAYFGNITSWSNTDFVAKESTPKSTQKNAKIASQASKMMSTGPRRRPKNWVLYDPKSKKSGLAIFEIKKATHNTPLA